MAVLAAGPRLGLWKRREPETQGGGQAGGSAEKPGGEVDPGSGGEKQAPALQGSGMGMVLSVLLCTCWSLELRPRRSLDGLRRCLLSAVCQALHEHVLGGSI